MIPNFQTIKYKRILSFQKQKKGDLVKTDNDHEKRKAVKIFKEITEFFNYSNL